MTDISPGLYLVATPIGNARDITLRALDILGGADVLVAEDTRTLRRLLEIHGVALGGRALWAYHDHSSAGERDRVLDAVAEGRSVAYCSDAGTPLVADPGFALVRAARERGLAVTAAPGASSVLSALSLGGLPTDRFCFAGFAPKSGGSRDRWLTEIGAIPATLVIFETAKRVSGLLDDLCKSLGETRQAALCRELTKRFEEVRGGTLADLRAGVEQDPPRGEIVLVIARPEAVAVSADDLDAALDAALGDASLRDAVDDVAAALDLPRRQVYQRALEKSRGK